MYFPFLTVVCEISRKVPLMDIFNSRRYGSEKEKHLDLLRLGLSAVGHSWLVLGLAGSFNLLLVPILPGFSFSSLKSSSFLINHIIFRIHWGTSFMCSNQFLLRLEDVSKGSRAFDRTRSKTPGITKVPYQGKKLYIPCISYVDL